MRLWGLGFLFVITIPGQFSKQHNPSGCTIMYKMLACILLLVLKNGKLCYLEDSLTVVSDLH